MPRMMPMMFPGEELDSWHEQERLADLEALRNQFNSMYSRLDDVLEDRPDANLPEGYPELREAPSRGIVPNILDLLVGPQAGAASEFALQGRAPVGMDPTELLAELGMLAFGGGMAKPVGAAARSSDDLARTAARLFQEVPPSQGADSIWDLGMRGSPSLRTTISVELADAYRDLMGLLEDAATSGVNYIWPGKPSVNRNAAKVTKDWPERVKDLYYRSGIDQPGGESQIRRLEREVARGQDYGASSPTYGINPEQKQETVRAIKNLPRAKGNLARISEETRMLKKGGLPLDDAPEIGDPMRIPLDDWMPTTEPSVVPGGAPSGRYYGPARAHRLGELLEGRRTFEKAKQKGYSAVKKNPDLNWKRQALGKYADATGEEGLNRLDTLLDMLERGSAARQQVVGAIRDLPWDVIPETARTIRQQVPPFKYIPEGLGIPAALASTLPFISTGDIDEDIGTGLDDVINFGATQAFNYLPPVMMWNQMPDVLKPMMLRETEEERAAPPAEIFRGRPVGGGTRPGILESFGELLFG
ncbi:MAG: hypothetical protein GF364_22845 [Candidatus Lokiarchaeota archaeon]|nr:hypothetical protein [Candidatus Lokiarchaeota archaeon]